MTGSPQAPSGPPPPAWAPPGPDGTAAPANENETDTAVLPVVDAETVVIPRVVPAPPAAPPPALPPPAEHPPARTPGWWRRNRWGLLVLVPVLALALGPSVKDGYELYSRMDDHEPVSAGADGWVAFSGARIRLAELVEATNIPAYGSKPFQLPEGVRAWRATMTFEASNPKAVSSCKIELEDRDGRVFTANPVELSAARVPYAGCTPDDDAKKSSFQAVAYFVLPQSAKPAAVRITRATETPRYARLTAG